MTDYTTYHYSKTQWIETFAMGATAGAGVAYIFYNNLIICLLVAPAGGILYLWYRKRVLAEQRRMKLMTEFKDAMDSMVSALVAGYSMENAVTETYQDLMLLYGHETPMIQELGIIRRKLMLHHKLDSLFLDLGRRSGLEDIVTFAQIYATARRSGGNLVQVMRRTAANIGEKIEIQREIQTMISGKKMESLCMMVIPLGIILYLKVTSPGFLDPVYSGLQGRGFMTVALITYIVSIFWSRKIMDITC